MTDTNQISKSKKEKKKKNVWMELGLTDALAEACELLEWKTPTPIQREAIPFAVDGKDIIGLAQTGSGKTGAFALPVLEALLKDPRPLYCLVIAPTRELAYQIGEVFDALGAGINLRTAVLVGGMDIVQQAIMLAKRPHVVIGTPGRIIHHLENTNGFSMKNAKFLILDEADRLLNMDFEEELDNILRHIPKERQTFLFSATMTSKVAKLQRAALKEPVKVEVSSKYDTADKLTQTFAFVPFIRKECYCMWLLTERRGQSTIIFTDTVAMAEKLALMARHLGFRAVPLHGKMSQDKRLGALLKFKAKERNILVATDVASRGLDIPLVDFVINFDIPNHSKDYIHRVGRTARAGHAGRAISIVTQYDVELFQRIEHMLGHKIDQDPYAEETIAHLIDRVDEASRACLTEARENIAKHRNRKKGRRDEDGDTGDFDTEGDMNRNFKRKSGTNPKKKRRKH